jgi:murein DD-endopeptidase MepM/ murein hydrolase activator NlpD
VTARSASGAGCGLGCGCGGLVVVLVAVMAIGLAGAVAGSAATMTARVVTPPGDTAGIPPAYLALYQDAAARFELDWEVLAAVGRVETNHGRNRNGCAPNFAGAQGPMQFLPATFVHAAKLAHIADPDICDPVDAIPAAAAYLASNGAPKRWDHALYRYNPADWYPPLVMGWAVRYGYGASVVWPTEGRISQRFGPTKFTGEPAFCYEGTCYAHFHDGLDIATPVGTLVLAMAAGRVILAGRVADGAVVVMIDHGAKVETLYGHLEPALAVRNGDQVTAGQLLGTVGLTGHTTGPHLHFELWNGAKPIDPLTVLPVRP